MSEPTPPVSLRRWTLWLPLGVFAGFVILFLIGLLRPAEREVRSALIGKPLPEFALPQAIPERPGLATADFRGGKPRLLNVFASWCVPCAVEAPQLAALKQAGVEIHGVAVRDKREDLERFLARHGNPFARIGADEVSKVQFALGSSGYPESFIVDGRGVIRYQHIGEIRPDQVEMILTKLKEAEQ
ncbi:DsbE family thiol:disulfide interchange protein [Novosphingobium sp.]|uniref:DsbE family thiol:disulfide interchange protein n=1 Tax=Novosphingobium sp. TaxID=1874826 RepID=UPI001EC3CC26|nr:DsbE family thiol:disulfide interchange protein [Novosphingobium sp.]MBK6800976.1 DsbE family thiol:disulfide interchange protein [Novosphingobium sp.]MBK9011534.1 DsbE family thiol:disulfide interchange protein [Novosphingobium sp.]